MLFTIKCSQVHPLSGALPPRMWRCCGWVANRYSFAPRFRTVELLGTAGPFCSSQYLYIWNNLNDPVFNGVGLAGFKSIANAFLFS